jgi:hypothetical protein
MNNLSNIQGELILYQKPDSIAVLEVRIDRETIWLSQRQMADLFACSPDNIGLHIRNIYKDKELSEKSTTEEFSVVQTEGKRKVARKLICYNLDAIISVGYRVNSVRGTQFRIWANQVLKEYLLKGYAIHQRIDRVERKLLEHDQKFDLLIRTNLPPNEGIFFDGQIFEAHHFVSGLVRSADKSILLIDNYVDESVLILLSKRKPNTEAIIYTASIPAQLELDLKRFNAQYPEIKMRTFHKSHDRFLIIDYQTVYHIGASLKDLGKKWFAFSRIEIDAREMIDKLESEGR